MSRPASEEPAQRETRDPVARAFAVLFWMVDAAGTSWGLREIATEVGMHPSTLHRVLAHLQAGGLVQQEPETSRYSLGFGFLRLAWKAADHHPVREVALPWMKRLVDATGETALLALYDPARQEMLLAATIDSPHPIRQMRQVAEWLPVTAGATGRAILAFLPEAEQGAILARPLVTMTDRTIVAPDLLPSVLEQVRRHGYAVSKGERTPGAVGIAAPIHGTDGRVVGSVGITLPEQRFGPDDERRQAAFVTEAARTITAQLSAP
ncbi:MAG: IclR family transcriptional regulator [Thermomicrobiales bacterium]